MKTNKWTLILIEFVAILLAGQNVSWADGRKGNRGYAGKAYKAQQYHGGGGHHVKKPHHGDHAAYHPKRPHYNHGQRYHRRPYRHYKHYTDSGVYLFSASIFDPAFAFSLSTGERW